MARRNQFQGIPGSANNMMKQAQRLQRQMEEQQKELEEKEFTAAAGGGAVEITVSGRRQLTGVKIDPEAVDPDDVEMLQDLLAAAFNEAIKKVDEKMAGEMSKLTSSMGLPPGMF